MYELTNHLDNVLVVISDIKYGIEDNEDSKLELFKPNVLSQTYYYAFGSEVKERSVSGGYRFGFNGKENDKETGTQDYGMRIYNPGLGRFLSVDPLYKKFSWNSTYAFAENDIISAIDLDGLEKYIVHLPFKDGQTWLTINKNDPKGKLGMFQYDGESRIYGQFLRNEEREAANNLEESKRDDPITTGVSFKYKLDIKFEANSSEFSNQKEADVELSWLSDRLKNNSGLKANISANLGSTDNEGNKIPASDINETGEMDGQKNVTNREATIMRGNAIKKELITKFGVDKDQVKVKEGKSLSGAENRKAEIKFEK